MARVSTHPNFSRQTEVATDVSDSVRVLNAPACPLCGKANGCAAVAAGHFNVECWCRGVAFPPELMARVPVAARGQACVCKACAQAAATPQLKSPP